LDDSPSVLLVDDDAEIREVVEFGLGRHGIHIMTSGTATEAFARIARDELDCVVTDLAMPQMHGLELIERIVANQPDLPVIVLTGSGNLPTAVAAMRAGAYDFLTKPLDLAALLAAVRRASERRRLRAEVTRLRRAVKDARRFETLVGASAAMQHVYGVVEQVAGTDATVLVTGQSGTGKEMVARALHQHGKRASGPFIAVDCASIPENLIESELFGHARGAFTDAKQARLGLLAQADKGTLFLDEIAELPMAVQPKLLRVLQERRVRPIGSDSEVTFDVRLVCATNRDLEAAVAEGTFREDLYYRFNVVQIAMPPLKARAGDVLLLAQHFVEHFARMFDRDVRGLSPEAAERLQRYGWPGNVRELRNAMERAVAMCAGQLLTVEDLPDRIRGYKPGPQAVGSSDDVQLPLDEIERRHILRVLEANENNKLATAAVLGIDRKTLYRKLLRYGVERE
jgi:two-component system response regulator HydG